MTLKVFYSDEYIEGLDNTYQVFFPFEVEKTKFIKTKNFSEADVIPMKCAWNDTDNNNQIEFLKNNNYKNTQLLLFMNLWHADSQNSFFPENEYNLQDTIMLNNFKNALNSKAAIAHSYKNYTHKKDLIFYDILWNRQKSYFTEYDSYDLQFRLWTNESTGKCYQLNPIQKQNDNLRKFLCPNRIYYLEGISNHPRIHFRRLLKDFLDNYDNQGYTSNPMKNQVLEPEEKELVEAMKRKASVGGGSWFPVANDYYERSYFSVFVETLSVTNYWYSEHLKIHGWYTNNQHTKTITEKTWDPLIKGHFILPFGYQGLIEDIKSYGFILPDFIDYSYDDEYDDFIRFEKFIVSLKKLLQIDLTQWHKLYLKYKHVLDHNRQLFYDRPYDSLYEKVLPYFDK
jgi:hypothetical protein